MWDHDHSGFDEFLGECFFDIRHLQRGVWLPSNEPLPDAFGVPGLVKRGTTKMCAHQIDSARHKLQRRWSCPTRRWCAPLVGERREQW